MFGLPLDPSHRLGSASSASNFTRPSRACGTVSSAKGAGRTHATTIRVREDLRQTWQSPTEIHKTCLLQPLRAQRSAFLYVLAVVFELLHWQNLLSETTKRRKSPKPNSSKPQKPNPETRINHKSIHVASVLATSPNVKIGRGTWLGQRSSLGVCKRKPEISCLLTSVAW